MNNCQKRLIFNRSLLWSQCLCMHPVKQIMTNRLSELEIWKGPGRSKYGTEGEKSLSHRDKRIRRQPEGNKFEAVTPLICLVLSATDKLGQIGVEKEKSDEKGNKKHLISPALASVSERHAEEKLYQLARLLQSPRWLQDVWGSSKEHNLLFNPNSPMNSRWLLCWASASEHRHVNPLQRICL